MVQRQRFTSEFSSSQQLKTTLFDFAQTQGGRFGNKLYLDSNEHQDPHGAFGALLALDPVGELRIDAAQSGDWERLSVWQKTQKDWCFGHISYDFKNAQEQLQSANWDGIGFPEVYFFVPARILMVQGRTLVGLYLEERTQQWPDDLKEIEKIFKQIPNEPHQRMSEAGIELQGRWTQEQYQEKFGKIQQHIQRGDIYETNFCQEFYREDTVIDPAVVFKQLNGYSKAPFSAFYQLEDRYALCASPERYLTKKGKKLISQPIKGTLKRLSDPKLDEPAVAEFIKSPKERRENIMITDLVRNDLSIVAARDSVQVQELCTLKSYEHVHQLVTTVRAELKADRDPVDALKATFPMGSMTGVPKIRALQLMEDFEDHQRGLYSGTIGYFTPEGDFDFNVVIRTLLYNSSNKYLSLSVGGALTSTANAHDEYQECLLKAESLRTVLSRG